MESQASIKNIENKKQSKNELPPIKKWKSLANNIERRDSQTEKISLVNVSPPSRTLIPSINDLRASPQLLQKRHLTNSILLPEVQELSKSLSDEESDDQADSNDDEVDSNISFNVPEDELMNRAIKKAGEASRLSRRISIPQNKRIKILRKDRYRNSNSNSTERSDSQKIWSIKNSPNLMRRQRNILDSVNHSSSFSSLSYKSIDTNRFNSKEKLNKRGLSKFSKNILVDNNEVGSSVEPNKNQRVIFV